MPAAIAEPSVTGPSDTGIAPPGSPEGGIRLLLRAEGAAALAIAVCAYAWLGLSWWWFAALFLVPDVSFAAYLFGPRIGAAAYNAAHSYVATLGLALAGLAMSDVPLLAIAAIWTAHVGFDRMLGYGLKYPSGFHDTHLGRIGRARA